MGFYKKRLYNPKRVEAEELCLRVMLELDFTDSWTLLDSRRGRFHSRINFRDPRGVGLRTLEAVDSEGQLTVVVSLGV